MNLFVPAGFNDYTSGWSGSYTRPSQGVVEWPIKSQPSALGYFGRINIARSPRVDVSVFFGITNYTSTLNFTGAYSYYYQNFERIAIYDGALYISLLGGNNELICQAQATFDRNAFNVDLVLEDIGTNYSGEQLSLEYEFASETNRPFGPCTTAITRGRWPIFLVEPNQSLIAKTYNIGQGINYGPEARAVALVNLTEAEIINLRAAPEATAVVFSNAEIDEELNLRADINAAATSSATILGPAPLNATATALISTAGNATLIMSLQAAAQAVASARGVPYIGTTILLAASAQASAVTKTSQNLLVSSRVSGMTIYVNLDTREFIVSPVLIAPISQLYFTRRDIEAIDVKFVRNGEVVELSYGSTGQLGIKNEFDGAALALDSEWSQKGFGSDATYQFSLNLNTQELDDLFVTDEEASISAKVELEWTEGGTINTTLPCAAIILNDVLRGTEGAPTLATSNSFSLSDGSGGVWTVTVDANGILTTTKV